MKVLVDAYEKLNCSELTKLCAIAADLFHLINYFGKLHNIKKKLFFYLVDNQLQESTPSTCGRNQPQTLVLYFNYIFPRTYLIHLQKVKLLMIKNQQDIKFRNF